MTMRRDPTPPALGDARAQGLYDIVQAAALTGVSAKRIRHYESLSILPEPPRTAAGYRLYNDADLHRLRFIQRARTLGFSMKQIKVLLALWSDRARASAEVKAMAQQHVDELGQRIADMQSMQRTLAQLARRCHGDDRPDCPILDDLGGGKPPPRARSGSRA
jgi:Cu(I)-responsive transcriptional regulator